MFEIFHNKTLEITFEDKCINPTFQKFSFYSKPAWKMQLETGFASLLWEAAWSKALR